MSVQSLTRAFALAVVLLMLGPAMASASPGDVNTPYDGHDTVAVPASPYASTAPFTTTVSYDSSAFTTAAEERDVDGTANGYTNKTGCGASPPYWGGRSGWVRFDSAVAGTLRVDVSTTNYDPFVVIWNGPNSPLNTTPFVNILNDTCAANQTGFSELQSLIPVQANRPIHVETLGFCGRASYWTASPGCTNGTPFADLDAKSPGGPTSVQLSFQCTNSDGDGFCDTLDRCTTIVGAQDGCPDLDRDGVLDGVDVCKEIFGTDADGCPPDLDGDGIVNAADQCVAQPGYAPSGCPDGDADRVFFPTDSCPTKKGIAPDGCADGDGDGFSDPRDPCPIVFGLPQGCPSVLGADINWAFVFGQYRLKRLRIKALTGSTIKVSCSAKKKSRCPFTKRTYTAKATPLNIKSAFRNRSLRGRPFKLTFRVTKRGYLGTYKRYAFDGRLLRSTERCIQTNGTLKRCPT